MTLSWWIALRHLRAGRRRFAAFITWSSVVSLMLGVMVLTVVVSIMNGFDGELRKRLLGSVPHLLMLDSNDAQDASHLSPDESSPGIASPNSLIEMLRKEPGVKQAFAFFEAAGMVSRNAVVNPVTLYGIDAAVNDKSPAGAEISAGIFSPEVLAPLWTDPRGVILGEPLAQHLGLFPGDSVALILIEPAGNTVKPKMQRFRLVGTFEIGAELDWTLAIVQRDVFSAQDRSRLGRDGVRVQLKDPMSAEYYADKWATKNPGITISTWGTQYGALFQAVRLEKILMFLVLLMVVTVAAFSIISGQLMVVSDKRAEIAILQTMGGDNRLVRRIFLIQGLVIAGVGIFTGLILGLLVVNHIDKLMQILDSVFGLRILEGTFFVELPVSVQLPDLLIISFMSLGLAGVAAWIPARRVTRMNPVTALHGA